MFSRLFVLCVLFGTFAATGADNRPTATGFSQDRAMEHLQVIAGDIGPRPMGSPAEQRAMHYALDQLKRFGCQDTFLWKMAVAEGVNTSSGVAVGVLKGETGRIILIGGHMDSAGPEIPGADDDGSGSACVLEVARVLCQRPHHSTLMFCFWGGEEQGLRGSQYFVSSYPGIDSVSLMFQLDMVDGAGPLDIDPDAPHQVSAPRWLVDAAYEEFFGVLHHEGLRYPTQFATLNASFSGATGSDHIPFIQRGIPALDFTSDVEYPIHTPLDNLSLFTKSGFQRAGDEVLRLVERFDRGQPSVRTEEYYLVQWGSVPLFIPHWFLWLFACVSVIAAMWLCVVLFRRERQVEQSSAVHWSGAKIFVGVLLTSVFVWLAPDMIGLVTGHRYPWAAHFGIYLAFSLLAGLLGIWLMLRWYTRAKISQRVAPMFLRAMVLPLVVTAVLGFFRFELSVYPAAILALFTLAVWLRRPWIGTLLLVLSVVIGYRVFFSEALGLFQRSITASMPSTAGRYLALNGISVLLVLFLALPFGYAAAALYRSVGSDFLHFTTFARRAGGSVALVVFVVFGVALAFVSPYDATWQPAVELNQSWNRFDTTSNVFINASEPMRRTSFHWAGKDTTVSRAYSVVLAGPAVDPAHWCGVSAVDSSGVVGDSTVSVFRLLTLSFPVRPLQVSVSFESSSRFEGVSAKWSTWARTTMGNTEGTGERRKTLRWYSFPDTQIVVPMHLTLHPSQLIRQRIEVTYDTLATPVSIEHAPGYVTKRFTITRTDSLRAPARIGGLAETGRR